MVDTNEFEGAQSITALDRTTLLPELLSAGTPAEGLWSSLSRLSRSSRTLLEVEPADGSDSGWHGLAVGEDAERTLAVDG